MKEIRRLEIDELGNLYSVMEYEDEITRVLVEELEEI
jgi:hypothetical protein